VHHDLLAPPEHPDEIGRLGRFRIQAVVGSGGMGIVYRAFDPDLKRTVAIKTPHPALVAIPEVRKRFLREARAVASLSHRNILPIHEIGEEGPAIYVVYEFAHGPTLAAWLSRQPNLPDCRMMAWVVAQLADAVAYAHAHKVLHRDIKPSNVMMIPARDLSALTLPSPSSGQGEGTNASAARLKEDWTPQLTDFGLAKLLDEVDDATSGGVLLGTPEYMAPEQIDPHIGSVGPATDVYGLGAMLYEAVTRHKPFAGTSRSDVCQRIVLHDAIRPRVLRPDLPKDLEAIVLCCLEKDPTKRYTTGEELAADLRRFVAGQPTKARPMRWWQRLGKWCARKPMAAGSVVLVALCMLLLSVGAPIVAIHEMELRRYAVAQQQAAEHAQRLAKQSESDAIKSRDSAEEKQRQAENATKFLLEVFQLYDPIVLFGGTGDERGSAELTASQLLELGAARLGSGEMRDQPLARAALMDAIGNAYRSMGKLDEAESLLTGALELRRSTLEKDHLDIAASLFSLAWYYNDLGRYEDAEPLYRESLRIRKDQLTDDHVMVADVKMHLGWNLADRHDSITNARIAEAGTLFGEAIRTYRTASGSRRKLGFALIGLGMLRLNQANSWSTVGPMAEGLAILEVEGGDFVGGGVMLFARAKIARERRQFDEAVRLYRKVIEHVSHVVGTRHPLVGIMRGDLAGCLRQQGDLVAAEAEIRLALDIGRNSLLRHHPAMIEGLRELGIAMQARGNFDEAKQLYEEAMEVCRRTNRQSDLHHIERLLQKLPDRSAARAE
jgi:tetratricopeptide (TPR) repeat protein